MLCTILLGLVALIFVLSMVKIMADVKHKKSGRFIVKESILLSVLVAFLLIADIQCTKKRTEKESGGETAGETEKAEETRENKLLAQLLDYLGVLVDTDVPQLQYYLEQGQKLRAEKEYDEALDIYQQALDLNLSDQERLPFFVLMGNCEAHLKEHTSAINYYYQAERICKDTEDDSALVVVYSNLALVHQLADDPKAAKETYFSLLDLFRKLGEGAGEKNALANIGFIYQTQGAADSASFYHEKSLEIPATRTSFLAQAAELTNLAMAYGSRGMLDSALTLHEQALLLFRQAGDRKDEASVLANLGLIYQEKGDLEKATDSYQRAFDLDSAIGNIMGQAGDLNNLGSVSEQRGDLAGAKRFYQRALLLFEKQEATNEMEFVRGNLQRVESKLKE